MPGSLFSPKLKLMSREESDYAPEKPRITIEMLHDGSFTCCDGYGKMGSHKNIGSVIKAVKGYFSEENESEMDEE